MRLGLCCTFLEAPIHFRRTTARYLARLQPSERVRFLRTLLDDNAEALRKALLFCAEHGIGAFRLSSQIFPVYTHPKMGYRLDAIDPAGEIRNAYAEAGALGRALGLRLSLHPDPFVVLGSPTEAVVRKAVEDLEYHAEVAELVGAEQITVHGGGGQGGKEASLARLRRSLSRLRPEVRPGRGRGGRGLLRHLGRPRTVGPRLEPARWVGGAEPPSPRRYVDPADVPRAWMGRALTVDVKAKAKERAVLRLARDLGLQRASE